ncbi:Leucine-rich repeat-containing G-protein coupled receptor 4 [Nymphon striatum]|nr:Leucine-rich repeat-containing G-protein coupled receptor 4 [Nymphon striatum]
MFLKLIILLLLGMIPGIQLFECPPETSISPCLCDGRFDYSEYVCYFSNGNSTDFLKVKGSIVKSVQDHSITSLTIGEMRISRLSKDILANITINNLTIDDTDISEIDEDAFKDSLNSLTSLSISHSNLIQIPIEAISNVTNLKTLVLTDSSISSIAKSEMDELPTSITWLELSNNKISSIDPNAFDELVNLEDLWLDSNMLTSFSNTIPPKGNHIKEIENITWSTLPLNSELNLNYNSITALPKEEILESIINKKITVDLEGNKIICGCETKWILKLPSESFDKLFGFECAPGSGNRSSKNLEDLEIEMFLKLITLLLLGTIPGIQSSKCPPETSISPCVCDDSSDLFSYDCYFSNGNSTDFFKVKGSIVKSVQDHSITSLTIGEMRISRLSKDILANITINHLTIDDTDISEIDEDAFKDSLNSLTSLTISHSNLIQIPIEAISNVTNLKTLVIRHSSISSIAKSEMDELPTSITWLELSNNKISTIDPNAFDELVNLEDLWLDLNMLTSFSNTIPPKLNYIHLLGNHIKEIENITWSTLPLNSELNLNYNYVTALPKEEILEYIINKKITVDLEGNKIICGCETKWILKLPSESFDKLFGFECAPGSGNRSSKNLEDLEIIDYSDC